MRKPQLADIKPPNPRFSLLNDLGPCTLTAHVQRMFRAIVFAFSSILELFRFLISKLAASSSLFGCSSVGQLLRKAFGLSSASFFGTVGMAIRLACLALLFYC